MVRELDPHHDADALAIRAIASLVRLSAPTDGTTATTIPFLSLIRSSRPTVLRQGMLRPSICIVVEGRKKFHLGDEILRYGAGSYLASTIDMPVAGHVVGATRANPYLGVCFEVNASEIAAVQMEAKLPMTRVASPVEAAFVGRADAKLLDVVERILQLLSAPVDAAFLAPSLKRELIYRFLTGDSGHQFQQSVLFDRSAVGVGRALTWLKGNFARPLKIEELAKVSKMSVSSLHHKFKAVTKVGPLQYQKRMRLEEARRQLLSGSADASSAAFAVGYESVSQFSREYRRLFGLPPLRDVKAMRGSVDVDEI